MSSVNLDGSGIVSHCCAALLQGICNCQLLSISQAPHSSRQTRLVRISGSSPATLFSFSSASHSATERWFMHTVTTELSYLSLQVLKAMNVRTFSRMAHRNHVRQYVQPSVLHKWPLHKAGLMGGLKRRKPVSLMSDGFKFQSRHTR